MKIVKYPVGRPFSVKEIHGRLANLQKEKAITPVGLFLKIKRDLVSADNPNGILEIAGTRKKGKGRGRGQILYKVRDGMTQEIPVVKSKVAAAAKAKVKGGKKAAKKVSKKVENDAPAIPPVDMQTDNGEENTTL